MKRTSKVNLILGIIAVVAIIIAIFALCRSRTEVSSPDYSEYQENIRLLNDTIKVLREDISRYQEEITRLDLERENIKKQIEIIIKDNEKIDTELANGDWDYNIRFLTDYLSKKDSLGE